MSHLTTSKKRLKMSQSRYFSDCAGNFILSLHEKEGNYWMHGIKIHTLIIKPKIHCIAPSSTTCIEKSLPQYVLVTSLKSGLSACGWLTSSWSTLCVLNFLQIKAETEIGMDEQENSWKINDALQISCKHEEVQEFYRNLGNWIILHDGMNQRVIVEFQTKNCVMKKKTCKLPQLARPCWFWCLHWELAVTDLSRLW